MQLWCRRCRTSFEAPASGLVPCPSCGSSDVSGRSPLAATTERPQLRPPIATLVATPDNLPQPAPSAGSSAQAAPPVMPSTAYYPQPAPPSATYPTPHQAMAPEPHPVTHGAPYGAAMPAQMVQPGMSYPGSPQPGPYMAPYGQHYAPPPAQVVVIQNHIQPYAAPMPVVYQRRKDATVATLLSFFLPGAGQMYNGQIGKGLAFMLVSLFVNVPLMFVGIGVFTGMATWVWSMLDANRTAEGINRGEIVG